MASRERRTGAAIPRLGIALSALLFAHSIFARQDWQWAYDQAASTLEILAEGDCLPPQCVMVFLGRSVGPVQALAEIRGLSPIHLPISNFRNNPLEFETIPYPYTTLPGRARYLRPLDQEKVGKLNLHFEEYFRPSLEAGAKEFRLIDISYWGGFSQLAVNSYLKLYLSEVGSKATTVGYPIVPREAEQVEWRSEVEEHARSPERVLELAPLYGIERVRIVKVEPKFFNRLNTQVWPAAVGAFDVFGRGHQYPSDASVPYQEMIASFGELDRGACFRPDSG